MDPIFTLYIFQRDAEVSRTFLNTFVYNKFASPAVTAPFQGHCAVVPAGAVGRLFWRPYQDQRHRKLAEIKTLDMKTGVKSRAEPEFHAGIACRCDPRERSVYSAIVPQ